jgi:hypothetical protein
VVVAELYRVIDVTSHEHDVRGAVGRPGHRDAPAVAYALESVGRPSPPGGRPGGRRCGWPATAAPYVDHLHIFGPAATDVVE